MRDEMLRKLDELMARIKHPKYEAFAVLQPNAVMSLWNAWIALRAELAAERCDNCVSFAPFLLAKPTGECRDLDDMRVAPDFCCSHFTKKEPTP